MTIALVLALVALDAEALLDATGRYVEHHRREFREYVCAEEETQRFFERSGKVRQIRRIVSDYYVVSLPDSPEQVFEFRDILRVDGRRRLRDENALRSLLELRGPRFEEEYLRLREEWSRYNLFSGRGFLSNVALALLEYAGSPARRNLKYTVAGRDGDDYVLKFSEPDRYATLRRGGGFRGQPLAVRGLMRVSPDGSVRSVEAAISIEQDDGSTRVKYTVEYGPGPDGLRAPLKKMVSVHRPDWESELVSESVSLYSDYRRIGYSPP